MAIRQNVLTPAPQGSDTQQDVPRVWNKHHGNAPKHAVYIGRGSPWGNPFTHMKNTKAVFLVDTREEAITRFEELVRSQPDMLAKIKRELRGKHLVCFCAPKPCHGDVLLRIANENEP